MSELRGNNMKLDFVFKFNFQFIILFISVLLLGNNTYRCAPVKNSTSELPLDNIEAWHLMQKDGFLSENTSTTSTSEESIVNSKYGDGIAAPVSLPAFVPVVNATDNEFKEVQDIQKLSESDITADSFNTLSESTTLKVSLSINDHGDTEHVSIGQSMENNATSPSDEIGDQDADLEFHVRENEGIDNSNISQGPTTESDDQIFSETISKQNNLQNYSTTLSGPSTSEIPQSSAFQENIENSTPSKVTMSEFSLSSDLQGEGAIRVELLTMKENINTDDSTSKTESTPESDFTMKGDLFPTTHAPPTFKNLQTTHSSQPEHIGNNGYESDEYVDELHQAMVSHGPPDSFSEDEEYAYYQPIAESDESPGNLISGGTPVLLNGSVSSDMAAPSAESVGSLKVKEDVVDVDKTVNILDITKEEVDMKVNTEEKKTEQDYQADQSLVQNEEQWRQDKTVRDIIELPNGVVIDALFDNIDSLQDQLDICEEELRQRLVVRKDVFFGISQTLSETDEEVELPADGLEDDDDDDLASPMASEAAGNQQRQSLANETEAQGNKPTTSKVAYTTRTNSTNQTWDDEDDDDGDEEEEEEDADDDEKHAYGTTDEKSGGINSHHLTRETRATTIIDDNNNNNDESNGGNVYPITNPASPNVGTSLNNGTADDEAHGDHGDDLKHQEGRTVAEEDSNHVTRQDHSYYASVARNVIKRLSKRLRYLESSIEDCNKMVQSMARHRTPQ